MRRIMGFRLLGIFMLGLLVFPFTRGGYAEEALTWEYKVVALEEAIKETVRDDAAEDRHDPFEGFLQATRLMENLMDQLGKRGWELVSVDNGIWYFKRPLRAERRIPPVEVDTRSERDPSSQQFDINAVVDQFLVGISERDKQILSRVLAENVTHILVDASGERIGKTYPRQEFISVLLSDRPTKVTLLERQTVLRPEEGLVRGRLVLDCGTVEDGDVQEGATGTRRKLLGADRHMELKLLLEEDEWRISVVAIYQSWNGSKSSDSPPFGSQPSDR